MKKITLLFAALCCMCLTTKADDVSISVADVEALPGETVAFSLSLSNGRESGDNDGNSAYISIDYDVNFPATGFTLTGNPTYTSWPGATMAMPSLNEGYAHFGVASANKIAGTDVEKLMTVSFTVANNVAVGTYTVTVTNIKLGYNVSDTDTPANTSFNVKVVDRHTAVLDEESTTAPAAATGVDVTVKRSLKAGIWNTICLPFAMTAAQITDAFGEGTLIGDFAGITTTKTGSDVTAINITFNSVATITINRPYIIKIGSTTDISQFTVEDATIDPKTAIRRRNIVYNDPEDPDQGIKSSNNFIGTYVNGTSIGANKLFLSNNKFWYSDGSTTMKGFRGYFDFVNVLANHGIQADPARMFIVYDGEVTAIEPVKAKPAVEDGVYYNLMGVAVKNPSKGVFIKDGKKIVVK